MDEINQEKKAQEVNEWIGTAVTALSSGDLETAKGLFIKVIEAAPSFADAHYNLGVIFDLQKDTVNAVKCYSETLKYNPGHSQCLTNLGAAHSNNGNHAIAVPFLKRAVENSPSLIQPRINLGITYRKMEMPEKALDSLKSAVRIESRNPHALYLAGCAAQECKQYNESERYIREVLSIEPSNIDALFVLVDVLLELVSPEQAIEDVKLFIQKNPDCQEGKDLLHKISSHDSNKSKD